MAEEQSVPTGAQLIADFVNTNELDEADGEHLRSPGELHGWLSERGLLAREARPGEDDVVRAKRVREALRKLLLANNGAPLDPEAVSVLNAAAAESNLHVAFSPEGAAELVPAAGDVAGALARILATAYTSMADDTWERLKACRLDDCQWAFYDTSKNRSRTWCSMQVCGNRAKARAYRERQRG
jgi:predicted RNA-binding Zn ribbon-like protein